MATESHEGMKAIRLLMVVSSFAPLFIIWMIRGIPIIPDCYFIPICVAMVAIPNLVLCFRFWGMKRNSEKFPLVVGRAEDHRDHLLVYLISMFLPFYAPDILSWRELVAFVFVVGLIIFLFWYLDLHYVNVVITAAGYRVFTVYPDGEHSEFGNEPFVLLTQRSSVSKNQKILAYRISDTIFMEAGK